MPFEDQAFNELRTKQREALRGIQDWVFRDLTPKPVKEKFEGDVLLVERELRQIADQEVIKLQGLLDRMAGVQSAESTYQYLRPRAEGYPGKHLWDVLEEVDGRWRGNPIATLTDDEMDSLRVIVALLTWADELSNDGYKDPRLVGDSSA